MGPVWFQLIAVSRSTDGPVVMQAARLPDFPSSSTRRTPVALLTHPWNVPSADGIAADTAPDPISIAAAGAHTSLAFMSSPCDQRTKHPLVTLSATVRSDHVASPCAWRHAGGAASHTEQPP